MRRLVQLIYCSIPLSALLVTNALAADSSYTFTTLAGKSGAIINSIDATGSAAQFSAPRGIAVDGNGTVYVADSSNHTVRKVTAAGVVTTIAGTPGVSGTPSDANLREPFGVAVDSGGNVYISDTNNNMIRKLSPSGVLSTLAGGKGPGSEDGVGQAAKFYEPHGVAVDTSGNVYVADYFMSTIRKITPAGSVTTLAGSAGSAGFVNGQGTAAKFKGLQSIAVDSDGNLYVADAGNRAIRKITPTGLVSTFYDGSAGVFGEPRGVSVDAAGNVYVADASTYLIYKLTPAGAVSTFAGAASAPGTPPAAGSADGATATALFNSPSAVAIDSANNVYVADTSNNAIRKISSGNVTTLAGLAGRSGSADGQGSAARFEEPYAVAPDAAGNIYVADSTDHSIRKIAPDGTVTTLAGKAGSFGIADGQGNAARFKTPQGIATDSAGNVYVADSGNKTIRKITATGQVSTFAGTAGQGGTTDATGAAARFNQPYGVAVDAAGVVYVVDAQSNTLRKITPAGVVTTLAGTAGAIGLADGTGTAAKFSTPFDVTVDGSGNIYVCDHGNHAIRKVTPQGVVTTLAGSGQPGNADGAGSAASFKFPAGVGADSAGNVFVADTDNQVIRKITPAGAVTTVAGSGKTGATEGVGTSASFYNPKDVAVDASGNLYVADKNNYTIRKGSAQAASMQANPFTPALSDCLFDWAEKNQLLKPPGTLKGTYENTYYFRCYVDGGCIASHLTDGLIYYLARGASKPVPVGGQSTYYAQAGCK